MLCALDPAESLRLRGLLTEAEAAYHSLSIGGGVREIRDQNGEQISYNGANRTALLGYINQLRSQLGMCAFGVGVMPPARVYF